MERRYQGKEFRTHLQANSEEDLNEMIEGLQVYASEHGLEPISVLQRREDPDGGWEAIVLAHNWNPLKWVKEKFRPTRRFDIDSGELIDVEPEEEEVKEEAEPEGGGISGFARGLWEEHKEKQKERERERKEEEEFQERRRKGEVGPEELSPREQRAHIETARRMAEEAAKAAERARKEERKRAPRYARGAIEALEEAKKAEERAKLLETELYGAPHIRPIEIIRDRWGKKIGEKPLAGKRREEAIKLEMAQKKMTERGIGLIEERFRAAEEAIKERRVAKRRRRITGPAREVARGVAGVVEGVGRAGVGFGVRTEPYRMRPPGLIPTPRAVPFRAPRPSPGPRPTMGTPPRPPDLSALRRLQTQSPGALKISLFPTGQSSTRRRPRKKNTYNANMRKMRRNLFGG